MRQPVSTSPTIEPASAEEVETISRLAAEIWGKCYADLLSREQIDYMLARMYSLDTLRDEMCSGGIRYEFLRMGKDLAGFAAYGPTEVEGAFKLHKLYLRPEWHGLGLGSRFLEHCERAVKGLGAKNLVLNVNKGNTKAIQAYRRNGYTVLRAETNDIGEGFVMDDYVMGKELGG